VSKASASTNARLLAQLGVIEQVRRQGTRRDYYRMAPDLFERSMAQRLARWRRFTEVIGEGRRTLPLASAEVRLRLEQYESAFSYIAEAIGRAMVQWRGVPSRRLASAGPAR
jgi:DNA-binding transcriptional regulator GbsR (MarR family)